MLNPKGRLEDRDGNDEVRCEDDILVPVNGQTVRVERFFDDVEISCNISEGWEFVDDVVVCIGFNKSSWGSSCR